MVTDFRVTEVRTTEDQMEGSEDFSLLVPKSWSEEQVWFSAEIFTCPQQTEKKKER